MSEQWELEYRSSRAAHSIDFPGRLEGEEVQVEDGNIGLLSGGCRVAGRVLLTQHRLRFEGNESSGGARCVLDVPLGHISRVDKMGHSNVSRGENAYGIAIACKDGREVKLLSQQATHSRRALFDALSRCAFPVTNKQPLFCVTYRDSKKNYAIDGWKLYNARAELSRQGVPNDAWSLCEMNTHYQLSDTYPSLFAVPSASMSRGRDFIQRVAEFRSRQRIPVLSWLHPSSQASITRCSQPLVGVTNRKNVDDQMHLQNITGTNANAHMLLIYDARPMVNAKVNRAKGGGFEEDYERCELSFLNIHNIHVVRDSLRKLVAALYPRVDAHNYLKMVDECKWLSHINSILEGASSIVYEIESNSSSVLVHCSDGWDRTAQLTSLSMLQLDAYYRTIDGFAVLIEKEWCSFGHKFAQRIGHGEDKASDGERSPIFVQFMDCVWQIQQQFPTSFEFTSNLLVFILDELHACRFGTFMYNCEKQRLVDNSCASSTHSVWSEVNERRKSFLNPLYNPAHRETVLNVNPSIKKLQVWTEYYARHNSKVISRQSQFCQRLAVDRAVDKTALMEELALHYHHAH